MKHILLIAVMLVLVFGSSAAPRDTSAVRVPGMNVTAVEIEGVAFDGAQARLKAGYEFQRESRNSLAVLKTSNVARIQTGTLTCTRPGRSWCSVKFYAERAACSSGCNFVGSRGGVREQ